MRRHMQAQFHFRDDKQRVFGIFKISYSLPLSCQAYMSLLKVCYTARDSEFIEGAKIVQKQTDFT